MSQNIFQLNISARYVSKKIYQLHISDRKYLSQRSAKYPSQISARRTQEDKEYPFSPMIKVHSFFKQGAPLSVARAIRQTVLFLIHYVKVSLTHSFKWQIQPKLL